MLEAYRQHVSERAAQSILPKPLSPEQVTGLVELLKNPPAGEEATLLDLISNRVPPGVDEAAYVNAGFLSAIVMLVWCCAVLLILFWRWLPSFISLVCVCGRINSPNVNCRAMQSHSQSIVVMDCLLFGLPHHSWLCCVCAMSNCRHLCCPRAVAGVVWFVRAVVVTCVAAPSRLRC